MREQLQNVDPVWFAYPIVVVAFSFGLVLYWHFKRSFTRRVLLYSLVAYAGAIIIKDVIQTLTASAVIDAYGFASVADGLYLGLQTVFLEVGGAYLVAVVAAKRGAFGPKDAEGYGLGLALWENGVLLGLFVLVNSIVAYVILASNGPGADTIYNTISSSNPALFYEPARAAPLVALAILERASSLLLHFAWGYLCVAAAVSGRKSYLLLALPMGLVDFLVVFHGSFTLPAFEGLVFGISLASLFLAMLATRRWRAEAAAGPAAL